MLMVKQDERSKMFRDQITNLKEWVGLGARAALGFSCLCSHRATPRSHTCCHDHALPFPCVLPTAGMPS